MNTPVYLSLHLLLEVGLFPLSDCCDCNVCWFTDLFESVFNSSECIPRSRITGSCDNSMFNFLRNCLIFHSGCTFLHFQQFCTRVSISPGPCQHLLSLLFFKYYSYLSRCEVVLTVVLIFISLLTKVLSIFSCAY